MSRPLFCYNMGNTFLQRWYERREIKSGNQEVMIKQVLSVLIIKFYPIFSRYSIILIYNIFLMKRLLLPLLLASGLLANAQSDYSLSFNGTNYVDCGNNVVFNANNIRTMECWVKFNAFTGSQEILSKSITGQGIELLIYNNTLSAYFMSSGSDGSFIAYPVSNLQTGVWYHVAVSWDGTKENIRLYVNGVSVGTRTDNGNITTSGLANPSVSFRIGNWSDASGRYFNGTIDEVRVWSVNRTAAQIKSNMFTASADETGLTAYYKMDDGSGTSLTNSTVTAGVTGTLTNSPAWAASPVVKNANAISFDGTNDLVNLGNNSSLRFTNSFTAELWVKSANWAVSSQQQLLSCFESGGYGISLTNNGMMNCFIRSSVTGTSYVGVSYPVSNLTNNTWYHVAGTFDGRYVRLYVNGSLVGTYDIGSTGTVAYTNPSTPVFVGADPNDDATPQGLFFTGQIDEVRLWNIARTESQIQSAMNNEQNPSDAAQTTGLVSYYTFNQGIASGTNTGLTTIIDQKGTNNARLTSFAVSGGTSNYVAQKSGLIVLPVTYVSFSAQNQGGQVKLQWSTAQEVNTAEFIIQHSTDGSSWTNIGHVTAAGNSNQVRHYSYVHTNPSSGSNQYRIMQTDRDGKASYSQVRKINISEAGTVNVLSNYIKDNSIRVRLDKPAVIYFYSRDGKLLLQKQLAEGMQTINVSGFAKGLYFLNISGHTEKIMLQ